MGTSHIHMMQNLLQNHKINFIKILTNFVDSIKFQDIGEKLIIDAIRYSLIDENAKYIRSFIVLEVAKMLEIKDFTDVIKIAIATEVMHCYSLIHDDLPSMDNSDTRRGKPSCHKKFSESTAILTGNAMQVLAFKEVLSCSNTNHGLKIFTELCKVVGFEGILSGQVLDLDKNLKRQEFDLMNYKKTGVLFEFCLTSVAILCDREDLIYSLKLYGKHLGIAYQMQDDLLDEEEDEYSYIVKFQDRNILLKEIEKEINDCKNYISHLKNNEVLILLPQMLSKRKS